MFEVENWPFSADDPALCLAHWWLQARSLMKKQSIRYLDIALNGGHTPCIQKVASAFYDCSYPFCLCVVHIWLYDVVSSCFN